MTLDSKSKEKPIAYNADDSAALGVVCGVISQLNGVREKQNGETSGLEVTTVDDQAESSTMWPRFSSAIPGFEAINKAGRWNYQRDRIYIRTDEVLRRAARRRAVPPTRSLAPSKDETRRGSAFCQVCRKKGVKKGAASRVLYDLRLSKRGIRTWVVRYHYRTFHCRRCHRTSGTPAEFRAGSMYGWNVTGIVMYMLIELGMTQRSIAAALNRIFKLGIIEREVLHLKEWAARFYDATRGQILAVMVKGKLVQADETSVIIKRRRVYVWVFTTLREVVYFYTETREASFLQQILTGFSGVLVSDFYAAYDSIPCPQQKCLLHLIRDLNDAALENPFDEGLKGLIVSFAALRNCIVDTIDHRGLKHHFLMRHRADVERFYRNMAKDKLDSESARKCRERLQKHREKLFTFLDHDGVPWNNDNAEHAIKAFARLRRGIEGLTTPKGIEEYLVLLSVCQTCKYTGVDFLDFLRSGEKDIYAFAESRRGRRQWTQTSQPGGLPADASPDIGSQP